MAKMPYVQDYNAVNLMTAQPTRENKAYLVDKRLVDFLLSKVTAGSLNDIKDDIITRVSKAIDKEQLFKELDEYIYLDTVINMLPKEEIANQVGKIALPVTDND